VIWVAEKELKRGKIWSYSEDRLSALPVPADEYRASSLCRTGRKVAVQFEAAWDATVTNYRV